MKNILKKLTLVTLALMLVFSMAACGNGDKKSDGKEGDFDFSSYPSDFGEWTANTVQTYLKDCGLLGNEEFMLLPLSETDVAPLNAVAGFMYLDAAAASVMNIVYAFDPSNADSKATLDGIIANKAIIIGDAKVADMDAVLGKFAFSYMSGTDDSHIEKLVKAIKELGAHYGVEPAYIVEE